MKKVWTFLFFTSFGSGLYALSNVSQQINYLTKIAENNSKYIVSIEKGDSEGAFNAKREIRAYKPMVNKYVNHYFYVLIASLIMAGYSGSKVEKTKSIKQIKPTFHSMDKNHTLSKLLVIKNVRYS
ncbi:hypothetical protein [Kaarinaea lacus]